MKKYRKVIYTATIVIFPSAKRASSNLPINILKTDIVAGRIVIKSKVIDPKKIIPITANATMIGISVITFLIK